MQALGTTPNLLRMAKDGVMLERHYSYKMCAPSRSSLQSGRSPLHCTLNNDDVVIPGAGIAQNMTGMASVMKQAGCVGKGHPAPILCSPLPSVLRRCLLARTYPTHICSINIHFLWKAITGGVECGVGMLNDHHSPAHFLYLFGWL